MDWEGQGGLRDLNRGLVSANIVGFGSGNVILRQSCYEVSSWREIGTEGDEGEVTVILGRPNIEAPWKQNGWSWEKPEEASWWPMGYSKSLLAFLLATSFSSSHTPRPVSLAFLICSLELRLTQNK